MNKKLVKTLCVIVYSIASGILLAAGEYLAAAGFFGGCIIIITTWME